MSGRKKISNEQKVLRGTDQPCRMSPQVDSAKMTAIPKVRLKGTAKKIVEYTATELLHKNLLELVGLDLLVAYCREMAIYHELMAEVEKLKHKVIKALYMEKQVIQGEGIILLVDDKTTLHATTHTLKVDLELKELRTKDTYSGGEPERITYERWFAIAVGVARLTPLTASSFSVGSDWIWWNK